MVRNTIFDPMLFINDSDWKVEQKQIEFMNHLINNITIIDKYNITKIYWTDELESLVWSPLPPWRSNRDYNNLLSPIFYKFRSNNIILIKCNKDHGECSVIPKMYFSRDDIRDCFLNTIHLIIERKEEVFLCLGLKNNLTNDPYCFDCDCHENKLVPILIKKCFDWYDHIDLNNFWSKSDCKVEKIVEGIEIIRIKDFSSTPLLYNFIFSPGFIKDLMNADENKYEILKNITRRLVLNSNEARQDIILKEEYLEQSKEYRFRINFKSRVHIRFLSDKEIKFLHYYGPGEHDKGL